MSNTLCAALIYSRTYELDYQWLVIPNDFTEEDRKSASEYIRSVNKALKDHYSGSPPRELVTWLFWSNEQYYVFGVVCNVSCVLDKDSVLRSGKDLSLDSMGRPIPYTFLGYVLKRTTNICTLPLIYPNLKLFEPVCKYISERWFEKYTNLPTEIQYTSLEELGLSNLAPLPVPPKGEVALNLRTETVNFYPNKDSYPEMLLVSVAQCEKPTSLLIGELAKKCIPAGSFLNVVVSDLDSPEIASDDVVSSVTESNSSPDTPPNTGTSSSESGKGGFSWMPWDSTAEKVVKEITRQLSQQEVKSEQFLEAKLKEESDKLEQFFEKKLMENYDKLEQFFEKKLESKLEENYDKLQQFFENRLEEEHDK
jgi:hypothetical protein